MADSIDQLMRMGDVFGVFKTSDQQDDSQGETDTQLPPAPEQHQPSTTTMSSRPGKIFHGRILEVVCSSLTPHDVWNLGLTCKQFGDCAPIAAAVVLRPTPLTLALSRSYHGVAAYLIEQGADVNLPEGLLEGDGEDESFVRILQPSRWYPIHFAVLLTRDPERREDGLRVLQKLLDSGASPNQRTMETNPLVQPNFPLSQVMSFGMPAHALELLLDYGADPLTLVDLVRGRASLLQQRATKTGVSSGGDDRELLAKCALLLFRIPYERDGEEILYSMMHFQTAAQEAEILLLVEELRIAASSWRQRSM
ncbi:hypothetical protein PGQ11_013400 [Apiospora arundinis]|uniref:Ankyrin n=1 Tax=Apiospora arundinis TaxID=335852 RepID=A0ABR2HPG2_9PEZI